MARFGISQPIVVAVCLDVGRIQSQGVVLTIVLAIILAIILTVVLTVVLPIVLAVVLPVILAIILTVILAIVLALALSLSTKLLAIELGVRQADCEQGRKDNREPHGCILELGVLYREKNM